LKKKKRRGGEEKGGGKGGWRVEEAGTRTIRLNQLFLFVNPCFLPMEGRKGKGKD